QLVHGEAVQAVLGHAPRRGAGDGGRGEGERGTGSEERHERGCSARAGSDPARARVLQSRPSMRRALPRMIFSTASVGTVRISSVATSLVWGHVESVWG